ncbi:MAG: hypothetical protein NT076_02510 [Candidatus Pacearchaeota archaeon]|nr:hypothetical protein [Candidatus Pacearchaeota archaeon]
MEKKQPEKPLGRTAKSRQRREELSKLMKMVGAFGLPDYQQLADKYDVSKMQISKDFREILKIMPKLDRQEVMSSIQSSLQTTYRVAVQSLYQSQHGDPTVVQKSISTLLAVTNQLINYLSLVGIEEEAPQEDMWKKECAKFVKFWNEQREENEQLIEFYEKILVPKLSIEEKRAFEEAKRELNNEQWKNHKENKELYNVIMTSNNQIFKLITANAKEGDNTGELAEFDATEPINKEFAGVSEGNQEGTKESKKMEEENEIYL